MASEMATTSASQVARGRFEVQLVSNEVKQPDFRAILEIAYKDDPACALSMIPLQVIMIQDVRRCYNCKLASLGDLEIQEAYNRLCVDGKLKEEYQIVKKKGLTRALDTPTVFRAEWITIVLSQIHDGYI